MTYYEKWRDVKEENEQLKQRIAELESENKRLSESVTGLPDWLDELKNLHESAKSVSEGNWKLDDSIQGITTESGLCDIAFNLARWDRIWMVAMFNSLPDLLQLVHTLARERDDFEKRLTESIYGGRSIAFDPDEEIASLETEREALWQRLDGARAKLESIKPELEELEEEHPGRPRTRVLNSVIAQTLTLLNENELTTLLAENARPTARVVELEQAKSDWERDCREVREMLWEIERIYDQNDLPSNYEDRDMYTRRVLNRFHIHQKDRGWDWGDGHQTLPAVPVELANLRNENVQNLQLLAEAKQIIESLHGQRTTARAILAGLGPVVGELQTKYAATHGHFRQEVKWACSIEPCGDVKISDGIKMEFISIGSKESRVKDDFADAEFIVANHNHYPALVISLRDLAQALGVVYE